MVWYSTRAHTAMTKVMTAVPPYCHMQREVASGSPRPPVARECARRPCAMPMRGRPHLHRQQRYEDPWCNLVRGLCSISLRTPISIYGSGEASVYPSGMATDVFSRGSSIAVWCIHWHRDSSTRRIASARFFFGMPGLRSPSWPGFQLMRRFRHTNSSHRAGGSQRGGRELNIWQRK